MLTDNKNIKKHFEKSMKNYDKNAIVQDFTAQITADKITQISTNFDNILELGAGTGVFTKYLVKSLSYQNYYANDLVEKSKSYIEKIVPNVRFLTGNALKLKTSRKMDLIVSNAVFQWFPNLEKGIDIIKQNLSEDGILAFTTFTPDNFKELKDITGLALDYKTENEIIEILSKDFEILYCESFVKELTFKTPLELLAHMKNTGVNSLSEKTWTVKKVKEFCDNYSAKYPNTKLTYAPIIVIARGK